MDIKKIIILLLGFILQGCSRVEHLYIEPQAFMQFYKNRKIFSILVDTRLVKSYKKGHLDLAINVPTFELLKLNDFNKIKTKVNGAKHKNWVLFLYAQNEKDTILLKNKVEELCKNNFLFNSPNMIYYLKGGYEALIHNF
jgi:hypothetical protein